ncbi:cation channel sperm-associated protein 1 isoform X2 [Oncorhynchus mykiss]|uniref:cation channel sperm-associated protein 1 isoform X2 n=1 Tax=Oncorhynchus mykiss TaxID=8022 RepID=UPI001878F560|nr:cation channel sperm-associated protein 1 isoform X2 [Oncorhynchus mykiss]
MIYYAGSTSHHKSSVAAKQPHKKRVFSTCAALDGEMLKRLIQKDEQRRIREQRNSRKGWLRAWGALQDWMHQLFRIIVAFTEDPMFDKFILFVVVLNTGTLVAQTFESVTVRGGWFFSALDSAFLAIYLMECVLKLLVWGRLYFKNPWNDLDFFIITMSLIDFLLPLIESTGNFSGGQASTIFRILKLFKGVRAIRAFRVLRTIRLFIAVLVDNFQMTIKRRMASKIQKFQDIYESEMQSMKKLEPQPIEPQTEEEFYEEALKLTYSENKYGKREIELITSYLRLLASIDQNQQTFRSQGCVLERLIDTFFEATEEDSQGNDHE